jgi:hypothetical protein
MHLANFSKNFGSRRCVDEIIKILSFEKVHFDQLVTDVNKLVNEPYLNIQNTIVFLVDSKVISINQQLVCTEVASLLECQSRCVDYLLGEYFLNLLIPAISFDSEFQLDGLLLSPEIYTYPQLAYSFKILELPYNGRFWPISKKFENLFSGQIKKINLPRGLRNILSPEALKNKQKAQEEAGLMAELWFLEREKFRLAKHPLLDSINHVSLIDVSLGYDIATFDSARSLSFDRFVEVKSYSGNLSFYISRNELETAKLYGDNYYLVLINRDKIHEDDYAPIEFKNPYPLLMSSDRPDWIDINPESYKVQLNFGN